MSQPNLNNSLVHKNNSSYPPPTDLILTKLLREVSGIGNKNNINKQKQQQLQQHIIYYGPDFNQTLKIGYGINNNHTNNNNMNNNYNNNNNNNNNKNCKSNILFTDPITITIYPLLTQFWPNFKVKFLTNNNNNNNNNNINNNYNHNNNNNFLGLWLNRT